MIQKTFPKFKNPNLYKPGDILIPADRINIRLQELAAEVAKKYSGLDLMIIGVLKGAFMLTADFSRALNKAGLLKFSLDFITVSSYLSGTNSSGTLKITGDTDIDPRGKHVLLLDDIIDSTLSLSTIHKIEKDKGAVSVSSLALLSKPERYQSEYRPDFVGFEIPNVWVQGFGMDTDQLGRENPNIIVGPFSP